MWCRSRLLALIVSGESHVACLGQHVVVVHRFLDQLQIQEPLSMRMGDSGLSCAQASGCIVLSSSSYSPKHNGRRGQTAAPVCLDSPRSYWSSLSSPWQSLSPAWAVAG